MTPKRPLTPLEEMTAKYDQACKVIANLEACIERDKQTQDAVRARAKAALTEMTRERDEARAERDELRAALARARGTQFPPTEVALEWLVESRTRPRRTMSEASVTAMMDGIQQADNRILQPLLVRPLPPMSQPPMSQPPMSQSETPQSATQSSLPQRYEVVCGHRRLWAARRLGRERVPVRVINMDDAQAAWFAFWDNLTHEDLNPMDLAESVDGLPWASEATGTDIGECLGFSRQRVHRLTALLALPASVRAWVREGRLEATQAELLARIKGEPQKLVELARRVVQENLSTRALERILATENGRGTTVEPNPAGTGEQNDEETNDGETDGEAVNAASHSDGEG